jgi:hypothetical protein
MRRFRQLSRPQHILGTHIRKTRHSTGNLIKAFPAIGYRGLRWHVFGRSSDMQRLRTFAVRIRGNTSTLKER